MLLLILIPCPLKPLLDNFEHGKLGWNQSWLVSTIDSHTIVFVWLLTALKPCWPNVNLYLLTTYYWVWLIPTSLTLDLVITHLLNEEVQQITAAPLVKEDDQIKMELDEAMAVACAKAILEVLCFFCNAKGHYKSDCVRATVSWT